MTKVTLEITGPEKQTLYEYAENSVMKRHGFDTNRPDTISREETPNGGVRWTQDKDRDIQ
jgi:hypothetical protein